VKRSLILIPIILLVIINACQPSDPTNTVHQADTANAIASLTATNMPPSIPTATPDSNTMVIYLNSQPTEEFTVRLGQLEDTMGASYKFLNVEFLPTEGTKTIFQVDVGCHCARNGRCCSRQRGFVYTMLKMKPYANYFGTAVPSTIMYMNVVTFDDERPLPGISVDWVNVLSFLQTSGMDGNRFGFQITAAPMP
jgi:hypothetical protein